jgi:hypothetical protein
VTALALLFLTAVVAASGCAFPIRAASGPYREFEVRLGATAAPSPLPVDADDSVVCEAVAWLIANRLGLPLPETVKVHLFVNEATFVEALIRLGMALDSAWDRRFAAAIAVRQGIFVRGDLVSRMTAARRAALYAHELAHVWQRTAGRGGRRVAATWIVEGHADWVKYRVLDLLGYGRYADSRDDVRRSVVMSRLPLRDFPSLRHLETRDAWVRTHLRLGPESTYGQSFLAVDWLVERYTSEPLHELLRRFATHDGPFWSTVYPISYSDFVAEFQTYLERLR